MRTNFDARKVNESTCGFANVVKGSDICVKMVFAFTLNFDICHIIESLSNQMQVCIVCPYAIFIDDNILISANFYTAFIIR